MLEIFRCLKRIQQITTNLIGPLVFKKRSLPVMSLQICSLLVYPVLMMHPEFLNKKNISQTPCCLLSYLATMNLSWAKILCQSLVSSILRLQAFGDPQELLNETELLKTAQHCGLHQLHYATQIMTDHKIKAKAFISPHLQLSWRSLDLCHHESLFRLWASFLCGLNSKWLWMNQWPLWWYN